MKSHPSSFKPVLQQCGTLPVSPSCNTTVASYSGTWLHPAMHAHPASRPCCCPLQDCEFTYLSTQILHLLGMEGPKTKDPAKYIRYIYNRIILENATVRAAAVSSLAKFGALVHDLQPRITVLLRRALYDNDDEVGVQLQAGVVSH